MISAKQLRSVFSPKSRFFNPNKLISSHERKTQLIIDNLRRNIVREAALELTSCSTYISLPHNVINILKTSGFRVEKEPDDELGFYYVIYW